MEEFIAVDMLGMNATKLNSLENFPNMPKVYRVSIISRSNFFFVQLELNENNIKGEELVNLKHLTGLSVLKLANNKISSLDHLECLKAIPNLINLDLVGNEITKIEGYTQKVFEMLSTLSILDGKNKEGVEIISQESDEDEEYGGEDGEEDDEDFDQEEYIDKISKQLTDEQKNELKAQGISVKQYLEGQGDDFEEMEEEGEEDQYGSEEGDEAEEGGANKRAKNEE